VRSIPHSGLGLLLALVLTLVPTQARVEATAQEQPPPATSAPPSTVTLQDGTPVNLGVCGLVTSGTVSTGQTLDFRVREQVSVGDVVVVPARAHAWGTVTDVKPPGKFLRDGQMTIRIDAVRLVTGQEAPLRAAREFRGANIARRTTEEVVGLALSSFVMPVLNLGFFWAEGENTKLPEKARVTAFVNGNFELNRENLLAANPTEATPWDGWVVPRGPAEGSLRIESEPSCAEIEIDGHYVDLTPTRVELPGGKHALRIRRAGFKPFEMNLYWPASAGEITATLEPESSQ